MQVVSLSAVRAWTGGGDGLKRWNETTRYFMINHLPTLDRSARKKQLNQAEATQGEEILDFKQEQASLRRSLFDEEQSTKRSAASEHAEVRASDTGRQNL
jgi:hypothetical protein